MKVSHTILVRAILDFLEFQKQQGLKIYSFKSSSGQLKTEDGRFFKTGKPGCPDITCCFQGRFIGLEVKIEKDDQSTLQKQAQMEIEAAGGEYHVVRSMADVKKTFCRVI